MGEACGEGVVCGVDVDFLFRVAAVLPPLALLAVVVVRAFDNDDEDDGGDVESESEGCFSGGEGRFVDRVPPRLSADAEDDDENDDDVEVDFDMEEFFFEVETGDVVETVGIDVGVRFFGGGSGFSGAVR